MALNDRLHFVSRFIRIGFMLVVPTIEEDGEKGGEGRGSVRTVTIPDATSLSRTYIA